MRVDCEPGLTRNKRSRAALTFEPPSVEGIASSTSCRRSTIGSPQRGFSITSASTAREREDPTTHVKDKLERVGSLGVILGGKVEVFPGED